MKPVKMDFKRAEKKLAKIARDRYYNIGFERTRYSSGDTKELCKVYVDPELSGRGPTWDTAFAELKKEMGGRFR